MSIFVYYFVQRYAIEMHIIIGSNVHCKTFTPLKSRQPKVKKNKCKSHAD